MSHKTSSRNSMLSALMSGSIPASQSGQAETAARETPPREDHLHPRVSAGSVGALRNTLAHITREGRVVELDPVTIDPSPYPDRLEGVEEAEAIEALARSIARNGQEVPVLVRPHPERPNHYQTIYGHRRVKAVAELGQGLKVRAIIRELTDEELLLAQGIENSLRQDLSWIEKALFARRLEAFAREKGRDPTALVMEALSLHAPDVSRFRTTLEIIPDDIVMAIGAAPKTGRTKWLALYNLVKSDASLIEKLRLASKHDTLRAMSSDERFAELLRQASGKFEPQKPKSVYGADRTEVGTVEYGKKAVRLTLSDQAFARFVESRLTDLHADYLQAIGRD